MAKRRKGYRFPKGRYRAPDLEPSKAFEFATPPDEDDEVGYINGKMAQSPEEWRVAVALDKLKREYIYQYPIGPQGIKGSYYVDFVVEDVPVWFPLEVQSERYHTGIFAKDARIRQAKIEKAIGAKMRFVWRIHLITQSEAILTVKDMLYNPVRSERPHV